jgi:ankyrin repeat protein
MLYINSSVSAGLVHRMPNVSEQIMKAHEELQRKFWESVEESQRDSGWVQRRLSSILEFEGEHYIETADRFDVNARSTREKSIGFTPLCMCVYRRNCDAVDFLLNGHGADVHATSDTPEFCSMTPLHFAAESAGVGKFGYEIMRTLLHKGADTFATDSTGKTALHYVCISNRHSSPKMILDAIYCLLQHTGPSLIGHMGDSSKSSLVCMKDSTNQSAFDYAFSSYEPKWPYVHILDLLIDNGANVNSDKGYLHKAIAGMQDRRERCMFFGNQPVYYKAIKILLMGGADPFKIYNVHSATTLALNLKPGLHPACDNLIDIFQAIQAVADEHGESGTDIHISISELGSIIEGVERKNKRCNSWGRRLDPGELHESELNPWW